MDQKQVLKLLMTILSDSDDSDKKEIKKEENNNFVGDYVIIRTYSAGVYAGILDKRIGNKVILKNARRLWYWDGAASLSQLAMEGVSKPENCKFPCEVNFVELEPIEIIPCTEKAIESIKNVRIWKS